MPSTNIAIVQTPADWKDMLCKFPDEKDPQHLDWLEVADQYQAFWVKSPFWRISDGHCSGLGRWGCETVIIFDVSAVSQVDPITE